ncbi:MAG: N-6 DNA methylase [Thermomicrobiales bacterium]
MTPRGTTFSTIRSEGGLLTPELLARLASGKDLPGLDAESYGLARNERLNEVISSAWTSAESYWKAWQNAQNRPGGAGVSQMRNQWLLPLFAELGYGDLVFRAAAEEVDGRRFVISHRAGEDANAAPVHTVAPLPLAADDERRSALDIAGQTEAGPQRRSPYTLLQEYLNRTSHLWGIVSDGRTLRLLRDNASLSRAAYIEVDLETMFRERVYADFVLLYRLLHRSRLPQPGQEGPACWLEVWRKEGEAAGARALDDLRGGVETAIHALGQGLLDHPANVALRARLRSGDLSVTAYYRQLLRLVYRFLFLLAAEERDLLFPAGANEPQRDIYRKYYGVGRLRELALRRSADRHDDLWQGVQILFRALREPETAATLGLAPLGSLFNTTETPDIDGRGEVAPVRLSNGALLAALRGLGWVEAPGAPLRRINFRDMDVEELGSVYEGLLEQQPLLRTAGGHPSFTLGASGERKSSGSYYTNPGLVQELIRSALDPAIAAARAEGGTREEQAARLLALTVCDPACGSGHFLLAAARRIGRAVAEVRAEPDEPSPASERAAIRAAIGACVYGVDLNPLAVDLCKVALWLEGQDAGKPLQFLGGHIRHGNALIGATAAVMADGVPDAAFDPVTGDSKAYASTVKKRNRGERKHEAQLSLEVAGWQVSVVTDPERLARHFAAERAADDLRAVQAQTAAFRERQRSVAFQRRKLAADLWTAAFFWPLHPGAANPPTDAVWRRLAADPKLTDFLDSRTREALRGSPDSATVLEGRELARQHHFFHWELEFEEVFARDDPGFDVVLGNPPWERIKLQEQEFFAQRDPEIAGAPNAAERKRRIEKLKGENPALYAEFEAAKRGAEGESTFLRGSGRFPLTGRGDINTYSVFSETNTAQLRQTGRAGMLVPTGIATDDTNKAFFRYLVDGRRLQSVFGFENEEFLFPAVHHFTKFCLLTVSGTSLMHDEFEAMFFGRRVEHLDDSQRVFRLSREDVMLLNPNTHTAPIFRSSRDAEITKKLYMAVPVLLLESSPEVNPWGVTFGRMFDMSNDSHLFRTRMQLEGSGQHLGEDGRFHGPDDLWERLYEAKMFHQYDHRFGTYDGQTQAQANQGKLPELTTKEHATSDLLSMPRYWIRQTELRDSLSNRIPRNWLLGYRNTTNSTNARTAIFSFLPLAATGHKILLVFSEQPPELIAILLANLNSIVFDFAARQKVGGTDFSYFILKQLPVLTPSTYGNVLNEFIVSRVLELSYTAVDLRSLASDLGYEGTPFEWDENRRQLFRAELDGIYAHLYKLSREDFTYILDQFPIVKRRDGAAYGEYRTARLCLEAYDYFAWDAIERLRTAVTKAEIALSALVVQRLGNDLSRVPEGVQAGQEAERVKQGKAPRAATLSDFLGAGYLSLLPKVIKPNREAHFADLFESNRQVDDHFGDLIGLRNALAHSKEQFLPDAVRTNGERELRWFAEHLGWPLDIVAPPQI